MQAPRSKMPRPTASVTWSRHRRGASTSTRSRPTVVLLRRHVYFFEEIVKFRAAVGPGHVRATVYGAKDPSGRQVLASTPRRPALLNRQQAENNVVRTAIEALGRDRRHQVARTQNVAPDEVCVAHRPRGQDRALTQHVSWRRDRRGDVIGPTRWLVLVETFTTVCSPRPRRSPSSTRSSRWAVRHLDQPEKIAELVGRGERRSRGLLRGASRRARSMSEIARRCLQYQAAEARSGSWKSTATRTVTTTSRYSRGSDVLEVEQVRARRAPSGATKPRAHAHAWSTRPRPDDNMIEPCSRRRVEATGGTRDAPRAERASTGAARSQVLRVGAWTCLLPCWVVLPTVCIVVRGTTPPLHTLELVDVALDDARLAAC